MNRNGQRIYGICTQSINNTVLGSIDRSFTEVGQNHIVNFSIQQFLDFPITDILRD